eukprot:gene17655-21052_t
MFDELEKYTFKGNFFYRPTDSLEEVCNAPSSYYGVFLVYALRKGKVELIYIGKSGVELFGNANTEGHICDGLRDNLVDGLHFDETSRKNCWPVQMFIEDIEALHVHWYLWKNTEMEFWIRPNLILFGVIGSRTRLRIWRFTAWGFESLLPHIRIPPQHGGIFI